MCFAGLVYLQQWVMILGLTTDHENGATMGEDHKVQRGSWALARLARATV